MYSSTSCPLICTTISCDSYQYYLSYVCMYSNQEGRLPTGRCWRMNQTQSNRTIRGVERQRTPCCAERSICFMYVDMHTYTKYTYNAQEYIGRVVKEMSDSPEPIFDFQRKHEFLIPCSQYIADRTNPSESVCCVCCAGEGPRRWKLETIHLPPAASLAESFRGTLTHSSFDLCTNMLYMQGS